MSSTLNKKNPLAKLHSKPERAKLSFVVVPLPRPAGAPAVPQHAPKHPEPCFPPELLYDLMKKIQKASIDAATEPERRVWKRTFLNFFKASRVCYDLGSSLHLRDLELGPTRYADPDQISNELDMLEMFIHGNDRFSFVRKLSLQRLGRGGLRSFYLNRLLLQKVAPNLQELTVSLVEFPPKKFWDVCKDLPRLKKLVIEADGIKTAGESLRPWHLQTYVDPRAFPYLDLLSSTNDNPCLEDFELKIDFSDPSGRGFGRKLPVCRNCDPWPQVISKLPNLMRKLKTLAIWSDDFFAWTQPAPPNLKNLFLKGAHGNPHGWSSAINFSKLEKLVWERVDTSLLVEWPLWTIKELHLKNVDFGLERSMQKIVRKRIEDNQIKVTVSASDYEVREIHETEHFYAESWFWRKVRGVVEVSGHDVPPNDSDDLYGPRRCEGMDPEWDAWFWDNDAENAKWADDLM